MKLNKSNTLNENSCLVIRYAIAEFTIISYILMIEHTIIF